MLSDICESLRSLNIDNVNDLRDCKNGIETLVEYNNLFNLNHLSSHLPTKLQEEATIKVQKKCQKNVGNLIRKRKAVKQVSVAQTIVNAVKPRSSISPIMFGLGTEIDKDFGSRWLLTELNRLGFSIGYD